MAEQAMMAQEEDLSGVQDKLNEQIQFTEEQQESIKKATKNEVDELTNDFSNVKNKVDLQEIHDRYRKFGVDSLKKYQDQSNDAKDLKVTIGQLDDTTSNEVAKSLKDLVTNLNRLNPDKMLKAPKNKLLRKIWDPIDAFKKRAMKASNVIDEASKSLQKCSADLVLNVDRYEQNAKKAQEYADAAQLQAEIGREVASKMRDNIYMMEQNGENPDLIKAWKSDVLAPLEQRVMDLSQIATNELQYVTSLDLLIKMHKKMIDEIYRTEQVALVKFQTAIQVANGIHVQETARAVSNQVRETSEQLDETNAQMLRESVKSLNEDTVTTVTNIESVKKSLDVLLAARDEFQKADADNADRLNAMAEGAVKTLNEMQESIKQSNLMNDKRNEILGDGHGVNDVDLNGGLGNE